MNRIDKITRLRHPGVLREFKWPADLPMFARFNLVYGWNGSGKTTLCRLFRRLEQRSTLAAIRDALLLQLLTGEVRVKDVGEFVERTVG